MHVRSQSMPLRHLQNVAEYWQRKTSVSIPLSKVRNAEGESNATAEQERRPGEYSCENAEIEENWLTVFAIIIKIKQKLLKEERKKKAERRRRTNS